MHSYIVGLALGDGNLSNSNGRAVKLRITCDKKYPKLCGHILKSLQKFLPDNRVSLVDRKGCFDVSCYSNKLENLLGWEAKEGSKFKQRVKIPNWILKNKHFTKECLRGIIQTDGSVFRDRKYTHVNVTSNIPTLADSIIKSMNNIGYKPNIQIFKSKTRDKFTIRISKDVDKFIKDIKLWK